MSDPSDLFDSSDDDGVADIADGSAFEVDKVDVGSLGPAPTAEPGAAVAAVDGQTLRWRAAGSVNYRCDVDADRIVVSMDADGGGTLGFQLNSADGTWMGSGAFTHPDAQHSDLYIAEGHITVDGPVVTYQGPMVPRSEYGQAELQDRLGSFTVNCGADGGAGGESPMAIIDGTTHTFPISGSQSFGCEFTDDRFDYDVDKYAQEDAEHPFDRLDVEGRLEGEQWIGHVVVGIGADRYHAFIPEDLAGMEVGPEGVSWSGTFTHTNAHDDGLEEQVDGSVSLAC
ncbi:MAG: hypothetical protein WD225_12900 [Ilumatobacteraceae bacterium]